MLSPPHVLRIPPLISTLAIMGFPNMYKEKQNTMKHTPPMSSQNLPLKRPMNLHACPATQDPESKYHKAKPPICTRTPGLASQPSRVPSLAKRSQNKATPSVQPRTLFPNHRGGQKQAKSHMARSPSRLKAEAGQPAS